MYMLKCWLRHNCKPRHSPDSNC